MSARPTRVRRRVHLPAAPEGARRAWATLLGRALAFGMVLTLGAGGARAQGVATGSDELDWARAIPCPTAADATLLPTPAIRTGSSRQASTARGSSPGEEADPRAEVAVRLEPYADAPITRLALCCDVAACADEEWRELVTRVARVELGRPLRPSAVADGWSRLVRTGYFRRVALALSPDPEDAGAGQILSFVAEGQVVITELDINYEEWSSRAYPRQFRDELMKRIFFRKSGHFPPQNPDGTHEPEDERLIQRQKELIVSLYDQQGYHGTEVQIEPRYHGFQNKNVKLKFTVREGKQPPLGQVLLEGHQAFSYSQVVDPISTGERFDFARDFFGVFGVGRYAQRRLREELREVEERYRASGYVSARVRQEGIAASKGVVFPKVLVREGPRVQVCFLGHRAFAAQELREVVTFREAGAFDDTEIKETRRQIAALYQTEAHYYAKISVRTDAVAPGSRCPRSAEPEAIERDLVARGEPGWRRVLFEIDEGPRVYVRRVEIEGNRQISTESLLAAMETKGVADDGVLGLFGLSAGVLQDGQIQNDLTRIRQLYADRGMPAVRFRCAGLAAPARVAGERGRRGGDNGAANGGPPRSGSGTAGRPALPATKTVDDDDDAAIPSPTLSEEEVTDGRFDLWSSDPVGHQCFQAIRDADPRLIVLRIELDEGLRTTTSRLAIDPFLRGLDRQMRDEAEVLLQNLGFQNAQGRWRRAGLNQEKLRAIQGFMLRYYHKQGYLQAQVTPECPAGQQTTCAEDALYGLHIDQVVFLVEPGPRTRVDGILMRGNLRTRKHILTRELLLSDGSALGTEALFLSQANLRSLGIFDSVSVETIGGADEQNAYDKQAAVLVTVEEGRYRLLDGFVGLRVDSAPLTATDLPVLYTGGLTVRDRNAFGRALEIGLGGAHANRIDAPQDVAGDSAFWESGPFLRDRRLFGTRIDFTLETIFKQGLTPQRDAYEQVGAGRFVFGYDFYNLSYPSDWGQGLRAMVQVQMRRERRRPLIRRGERPPYGDPTDSIGLEPALAWERRDNPLHPTRGYFVAGSAQVLVNREQGLSAPSFKQTLTGQWVESFFRRRLIAVPTMRLGAAQTDKDEAVLPSAFLFKAGGDGVAIPVRGYADASIDACQGRVDDAFCKTVFAEGDDAQLFPQSVGGKAMLAASLELRFPTFLFDDFWFAAFLDSAAIAPGFGDLGATRFFPSAGGGLRWLITGQIPLRLDVGYPLRETGIGEQQPRIHLNIFYTL